MGLRGNHGNFTPRTTSSPVMKLLGISRIFHIPEKTFEKWVDNSYQWASGFDNFKLEYKPSLPASSYPKDSLKYLNQLLAKHGRMDWSNDSYKKRLKEEIDLFHNNGHMDWLPYFFACESVSSWMESREVLGSPSRGSAGGVLLAYMLGITHRNLLDMACLKNVT